jgi:2'-5' RNA ligase
MVLDSTEGQHTEGRRLTVYALVIYIPDPLGRFLDDLRRELAPKCNPHAHVSVLPPRALTVNWEVASRHARPIAEGCAGFDVELTRVQVFSATNVIYLEIGEGAARLQELHAALSTGVLAFPEPYAYHPHVTLAQEFPSEQLPGMKELAERRWREFRGSKTFRAERAVFVRNTEGDCWQDLATYSIGSVLVP